jgi:membrane protease YdiL (CAAX protease family)
MKSIIEFGAIFAVGILNHMIGSFFYSKRSDYQKSFTVTENLLRYWSGSISGILVVLLVAINNPDGLASVGIIKSSSNDKNPFFIGIMSISFLILFLVVPQRLVNYFRKTTLENKIDLSNPATSGLFQYQSKLEKLAYLTVLPFIVISEDLIYRGYLVLMLGGKTHTYLPWIILSVILSVIIHLYQGRKIAYLFFQATAALLFIGLTIWTGNILTPIIAHLYYDVLWTIGVWKRENNATTQPAILSKGKLLAYTVFVAGNLLLLLVSIMAISYAG